jgi:hypothetical protein
MIITLIQTHQLFSLCYQNGFASMFYIYHALALRFQRVEHRCASVCFHPWWSLALLVKPTTGKYINYMKTQLHINNKITQVNI